MKLLATAISALSLTLVSWVAAPPCSAQSEKEKLYDKSYALVVGITNYEHQDIWKKIPNAVNDARSVAEFLAKSDFKVTFLSDEKASKTGIEKEFSKLSDMVGEDDRVLIFFAGHGNTKTKGGKDRGYIIPWDGTGDDYTYLSMDDLKKYSSELGNVKHLLFIMDSCYGGTLGRDEASRGVKPNQESGPKSPTYLREITKPKVREVLTAGGEKEEVLDGGGVFEGHSLFTGHLLSALSDARADVDNDGYITFSELVSYMLKKATTTGQHPHWDTLEGHISSRDFVFISPKSVRRSILIPASFEAADSSRAPDPLLQMAGPQLLLKDSQELQEAGRIWNVEFRLNGAAQQLQTRGDQQLGLTAQGVQSRSDYELHIKYWPLDTERVKIEARFTKTAENLPDIPAQTCEVKSLDFKTMAREILSQFSQDADLHLHLDPIQCPNCPTELREQMGTAIDTWLTNLNLPRIKYVRTKDSDASADIDVLPVMYVSPEGNRQVFTVNIVVRHASSGLKNFSQKKELAAWSAAVKEVEDSVETYLKDLAKQY